jgi:soluble lytic murein transglycosylase-like protein
MIHRRTTSLVTSLLVVLVAGACGDGGDPAASPTPEVTASPAETPDTAAADDDAVEPRLAPVPERDHEADGGPVRPAPFTDPDELAEQLVAAEQAIRDRDTSENDLAAWAWTQQQAYRDLAANPDWDEQVRDEVPQEFHDAFDANVRANREIWQITQPRESLPAWRIVTPPPPEELLGYYREAADEFGLDWTYLASIHLVETRMGRIRGVSVAGAQGPMQFMPGTWEAYGEGDVNDPRDAIFAAARYLSASGAPDDMRGALFAYNRSDYYVDTVAAYAGVMRNDERTYEGYYHWRVYYRMPDGDVVLPEGFVGEED